MDSNRDDRVVAKVPNTAYRGLLEVCEEYVETRDHLARLEAEIVTRTGRTPDEVFNGMRQLFAPKEEVVQHA